MATPLPPTLAGFSGPPRAVGEPIPMGNLVVTVQRVITLDAGSGFRDIGAQLFIQATGGSTLAGARLPGTALIDSALNVYEVDPAATSAVLTAAEATPAATPSSTPIPAPSPTASGETATPGAATPAPGQSARAVVGFKVPDSATGLELAIDGRASGGSQVLVKLP